MVHQKPSRVKRENDNNIGKFWKKKNLILIKKMEIKVQTKIKAINVIKFISYLLNLCHTKIKKTYNLRLFTVAKIGLL